MAAQSLRLEGNRALNEGRPQEAISKYTAALKASVEEERATVLSNRAVALYKVGRVEAAVADAREATRLAPESEKACYRLAKYLLENYELDAAEAAARRFAEKAEFDSLLAAVAIRRARAAAEPTIKQFELLEDLGTGNYSSTVRAVRKIDGKMFAIKMIEKAEAEKVSKRHKNVHNEILMEKRALYKVRGHPNVVWLHATFSDYYHLYYCMELCRGGELWARLVRRDRRGEQKRVPTVPSLARSWLRELTEALRHCHSKGLVHRDVKPENLMLTADGTVKLIDFGTAKDLDETDLNGPEFVGTPEYMAPEMVDSRSSGFAADWWALGIVAYQFYVGHTPYSARSPYYTFLKVRKKRSKLVRVPPCVEDDVADLIRHCLRYEPGERPTDPFESRPWLRGAELRNVPKLKDIALRVLAEASSVPLVSLTLGEQARARRLMEALGFPPLELSRRFVASARDAKHLRADPVSRTYLGHSQDEHGVFSQPFSFALIASPRLRASETCLELSQLRRAVSVVNRLRPPFLLVTGDFVASDEPEYDAALLLFRNTMSRVSESVPIVYARGGSEATRPHAAYEAHFGSSFFAFWCRGARFVVLDPALFDAHTLASHDGDTDLSAEQNDFLDTELEFNALGTHRLFFVSTTPPLSLPLAQDAATWGYRLLKGRVDAWLAGAADERFSFRLAPQDLADFEPPTKPDDRPTPSTAATEDDDDDEKDAEDYLRDCTKLAVISTSPVAGALGEDERIPAGLALVTVFESAFSYHFYDLESVPLP